MNKTQLLRFALVLALNVSFLSVAAFAEGDGSSGCGLGWKVNSDYSFIGTTTRNTTHVVLTPTFSMTSGTSGCDNHPFVQRKREAAMFAMVNHENLKIEMAQGHGEYIQGYARAFGCSDAAHEQFGQMVKANYKQIYSNPEISPLDLSVKVEEGIKQDQVLASACHG